MMNDATVLSRLILTAFRANGALVEAGDALVRDIGLTSARWQVLGALAEQAAPRTVSQIARTMGLTRQSVQRVADDLRLAGLIDFLPNPDHARSKLMSMTLAGQSAYAEALRRQAPWVTGLAAGLSLEDVAAAIRVLSVIADRLDANLQPPLEL
ncbi:MarR family transcriptional regulator [Brevundimonas sp.]|uniref:MarR family winged helix-turn-helix transcriptional regulator n=1 Tax=Brevundimonas sp. TaxID=1871086 RepID=UPI002489E687|nr:MarR family transcriptional regulator [Brevundimonas sp.]MDI1281765.1 MarR family transcriptional regulator [Brevundimonas sp.]